MGTPNCVIQLSSHGHSELCNTTLFSWALRTVQYNQCRKSKILLHASFSELHAINVHTSPTATPLAPNFWTDKIQNCLSVLQHNHRFRSFLSFWAATPLLSFLLSALRWTHACSKSNALTTKPVAFALSHTLAPTSGTISPKTSGTRATLSSFKSKLKTFLFSEYFS